MKEKFFKIVNYGISPNLSKDIAEQTRLVNGISFLGVPVCLTYLLLFSATGFYFQALVFLLGILLFCSPILLNKWFGLNYGRLFVTIFAPLFFLLVSVITGKDAGFYLGFLVIIIPAVVVFPSIRVSIIFILYGIVCMLASIYLSSVIRPRCTIPFAMAIYIFNLFTVLLTTLTMVFIYKRELEESRAIVEEKNKEITDSIRYAKRIQHALLPSNKYFEKHLNERQTDV